MSGDTSTADIVTVPRFFVICLIAFGLEQQYVIIMKKIILFLIGILMSNILFAQESLSTIKPINKKRPADFEYLSAPDSTGKRTLLKMPSLNKSKATLKLSYPIIFIHGLVGTSSTWDIFTNYLDNQYGLTYGGRFDFCLNYDGNNTVANKDIYPTTGADLALFTPTLIAGDYYYINFDVGYNGTYSPNGGPDDVKSNQQAIVKQGKALAYAISYVLQQTGRDKVILMGHSMGGLATREYLQNWTQSDGQHHIAKLVTTGTPHGGSNSSSFGIPTGIDEQSEAVRDLRRSYYYSGNQGVYLFGGIENLAYMEDQFFYYFYNSDVNCNGIGGTSESVTGLNQKSIYTNLDYSCIIGECTGCLLDPIHPGDGVVWDVCANLKNYYPSLDVNLFYYYASSLTEIHRELSKQIYENMQGLDEPNEYALSYNIDFGTTYTGFTSKQPVGGYSYDFDDYKFSVPVKTNISVNVTNIYLADLMAHIVDSATGNTVGSIIHSNGSSSINFTQLVNAGVYYFEIYGTPTTTSYSYPYIFTLNKAPVANFTSNINSGCQGVAVSFIDQSTENPSSWSWSFIGGTPSSSTLQNPTVVYNSAGIYPVTLTATNQNGSNTIVITSYITMNPIYSVHSSASICQDDSILLEGNYQTTSGVYYDTLTTTVGCDSIIETTLTVNNLPTVDIGSDTTICANHTIILQADSTYSSYLWSTGDTGYTITVDTTGVGIAVGTYWVEVTDSNGCTKRDSIIITFDPCTGINDYDSPYINIFPNPSNGTFTISLTGINEAVELRVINLQGQVVYKEANCTNGTKQLDISNYPKGVYFLKLMGEELIAVEKVVVE